MPSTKKIENKPTKRCYPNYHHEILPPRNEQISNIRHNYHCIHCSNLCCHYSTINKITSPLSPLTIHSFKVNHLTASTTFITLIFGYVLRIWIKVQPRLKKDPHYFHKHIQRGKTRRSRNNNQHDHRKKNIVTRNERNSDQSHNELDSISFIKTKPFQFFILLHHPPPCKIIKRKNRWIIII